MSLLREHKSADRRFADVWRSLRRILTAEEGGIHWADNIGEVVTYTHNSDATPIDVAVRTTDEPLAVVVLRTELAVGSDGFRSTANRVGWYWDAGRLRVSNVDDLSSSTDYRVTLGLLMG